MSVEFNTTNNNINNLIGIFDNIIYKIYFSSKRINFDEFDEVNVNEEELIWEYIKGCFSITKFPRGSVVFQKKNKWKMFNLNTFFMIKKNYVSNLYHNFPKYFKIKRSSGADCHAKKLDLQII